MEYQKIIIMVVALLAVIAIYFTVAMQKPLIPADSTAAKELLLKGMRFGLSEKDYTFAYTEVADGYRTDYVMERYYDNRSVFVQNPLSIKKVYFISNQTIMCIKYPISANESCAYVNEDADLQNYVESLSAKFFNDLIIEQNKNDIVYLIENNYLTIDPTIKNKTVDGKQCGEINYKIDFSSISLSDAARFGISSNTPKKFDWAMCIDNQTGLVYEKYFNYSLDGRIHSYQVKSVSYTEGDTDIVEPTDIVSSITSSLYNERQQYTNLVKCYVEKDGTDRDKCIMDLAINLRRKDLCQSAGQRQDMCLVSLVPVTKDTTICGMVTASEYMDDCYIELGGAYKNNSYCNLVKNVTKVQQCNEASMPDELNICDSMTDTNSKDRCNMMQAMYNNNTAYCSQIINQTMAAECMDPTSYNYSSNVPVLSPEYMMALVNSTIDMVKFFMELKNGSFNGTSIPMLPPIPN